MSAGAAFRIGNDLEMWDTDIANTVQLRGLQDPTAARLTFGSANDTNLYRHSPDSLGTDDRLNITRNVVTDEALATRITGDPTPRFNVMAGGKMNWGDGATQDTNLYRSSANELRTDDLFVAGGGIYTEPWRNVGAAGEPAFQNGWVNYDTSRVARFYKDPLGVVHLQGVIKTGTVPSVIFTLPAGYRHGLISNLHFPIVSNFAFGMVYIGPNGEVYVHTGDPTWVDLSSISFRAA